MSHIIILTRQKLFGHFFSFHKYISNISDNLWDEGCGTDPVWACHASTPCYSEVKEHSRALQHHRWVCSEVHPDRSYL